MKLLLGFTIFILPLALLIMSAPAFAQSNDEDSDSLVHTILEDGNGTDSETRNDPTLEGYTGTLTAEDPDNVDLVKEQELFGEDEADVEEDTEKSEELEAASHILKMEYNAQVQIMSTITEITFIEIEYQVNLEQEIEVKNERFRTKSKAKVTTDIVGSLAGNELFSCTLDIQVDDATVDVMSRYNPPKENEEEVTAAGQLALQLKFQKTDLLESWLSNCTAADGSIFNTIGDKEKYLYLILAEIEPSIEALSFEDYALDSNAEIDIASEAFYIEDIDSFELYTLSGTGNVSVEPL